MQTYVFSGTGTHYVDFWECDCLDAQPVPFQWTGTLTFADDNSWTLVSSLGSRGELDGPPAPGFSFDEARTFASLDRTQHHGGHDVGAASLVLVDGASVLPVSAVPEPLTAALLLFGLVTQCLARRFRRNH